uniref:Uncharacterized protein n=1 Tax=Triticum urartu TaxID=4572 RepID=A0A8R7V0J5_TRIUA
MPGGTSVMLLRLVKYNFSRLAMAPCCISSRFRLGKSLRKRIFSLGNQPERNVSCSPLYALVNCRHVKFDNRERDGRGSSLNCDQYRDNSYKFCPPTPWKRGDSSNDHSANRPLRRSFCRLGRSTFNRRTSFHHLHSQIARTNAAFELEIH